MNLLPQKTIEFSLIDAYFKAKTLTRKDVLQGIGDDAALLRVPADNLLVVAVDTMVAGVHFPQNTLPEDIGYKALSVNLSDLAAMGAEPAWMTLALTMPQVDKNWLEKFSNGLFELAQAFDVQLIGGDSTRGPLTVTVQVNGFIPTKFPALKRNGAKVGDKIYVSGTLGDAGLGLQAALGKCNLSDADKKFVLQRLNRPYPRIKLGMLLREYASSAIDVSDGLLADLGHILTVSEVGAEIQTDALPFSAAIRSALSEQEAKKLALTAGDDYELCFTVPVEHEKQLIEILKQEKIPCHCIGEIKKDIGILLVNFTDELESLGFSHWSGN